MPGSAPGQVRTRLLRLFPQRDRTRPDSVPVLGCPWALVSEKTSLCSGHSWGTHSFLELKIRYLSVSAGFPGDPVVENQPANAGDVRDVGSIPGSEDPLEEGMATHSSILVWRIPWTEEPGGLWSMGLQRVGHD